ncbi:hypothetical protein [Streptomyces sp. NPDC007856]|uniref:hypothetical protein n=1 Tax=Streptomyces sp. NPDC007856 TaxID=3364781 RepID=UPI003696B1AB
MGRRGDPRLGVRFLVLGPVLPALLWTAACDGPAAPGAAARSSPSETSSPSPSKTSAADLCTRLVTHWSREVLDGGTYGDYQSMGLSNGEYEILRDVVEAARAVRGRQGDASADKLIDRQARAACAERYRHGAPTESPWQ